ncbi:MAG TPA: hypothetical protein VGG84_00505 [Gemmatimonadaceae bacterium]
MRLSVRPLDQQDWLALTANLEREEQRPPVDWPTTYLSGRLSAPTRMSRRRRR